MKVEKGPDVGHLTEDQVAQVQVALTGFKDPRAWGEGLVGLVGPGGGPGSGLMGHRGLGVEWYQESQGCWMFQV